MKIELKPIGVIHSTYKTKEEVPIQASRSNKVGEIEVFEKYEQGLKDIGGFSHIIILYLFNKSSGYELHVKPFLDDKLRGLFATRAPKRPNPIGISIVKLIEIRKNILEVSGIDVIDETPLVDIKPYVPEFDQRENVKIGWLEGKINNKSK